MHIPNAMKMSSLRRAPLACRTAGFSLVEVLVALVVLSVGLLGIAALYVEGLRSGRSAGYRSAAVILAADMAERVRANRPGANAYAGAGPGEDHNCVNGAGICTAADLAEDDWFHWSQDLGRRLPVGATALVDVVPAAGTDPATYTITVTWPEPGQEVPSNYVLATQL
jgi:type IV pilus assembly protein PilV